MNIEIIVLIFPKLPRIYFVQSGYRMQNAFLIFGANFA